MALLQIGFLFLSTFPGGWVWRVKILSLRSLCPTTFPIQGSLICTNISPYLIRVYVSSESRTTTGTSPRGGMM